ncbi:hypothetical protein D3C71_1875390 [compost metagenome]
MLSEPQKIFDAADGDTRTFMPLTSDGVRQAFLQNTLVQPTSPSPTITRPLASKSRIITGSA